MTDKELEIKKQNYISLVYWRDIKWKRQMIRDV